VNSGGGWHSDLEERLQALEQGGLRRSLRELDSRPGVLVQRGERALLNFASNDYLGLAGEAVLIEAGKRALERFGAGAGASRLVCGSLRPHGELEEALAGWKGTESALCFSSGYTAATGTLAALVGKGDVVILDKLCHASLIDGARLSGATIRVFPHNSMERLEAHLVWARSKQPRARVLVVSESVFSMDGDRAPLRELVELKDRFGAWLMVDEAHAVGLFGEGGRGLVDAGGLGGRVEIQLGTLSKALGCSGGYICGTAKLVEWLVNRARSFVYSTAPPPVVAAMALEAVAWIQGQEARERRLRLRENVERWVKLMPCISKPAQSAILPVVLGAESVAVKASARMEASGFWVPAIRYPTVARGAARLRVTFSANHTQAMVEDLAMEMKRTLAVLSPVSVEKAGGGESLGEGGASKS
jgi:8-amino-7-oxononanoate synthase